MKVLPISIIYIIIYRNHIICVSDRKEKKGVLVDSDLIFPAAEGPWGGGGGDVGERVLEWEED